MCLKNLLPNIPQSNRLHQVFCLSAYMWVYISISVIPRNGKISIVPVCIHFVWVEAQYERKDKSSRIYAATHQGTHIGHYIDVIMTTMASQITSFTVVYSIVYSDADQKKHQSSAPLAFVWGIHRGPGNSTHQWAVTQKMFPFDDVITPTLIKDRLY